MPTNLTAASSFDTATGPVGGDIRNAASVRSALQAQTNRSQFVYDASAVSLADIAALKAIASPADGLVRMVDLVGSYVFHASSVEAESLPWIVQPTTGSGRWKHVLSSIVGAQNGLAKHADPVADIAALKAIASPTNGTVRTVLGEGVYVFESALSATPERLPFIVAPTTGTGKWRSAEDRSFWRLRTVDTSYAASASTTSGTFTSVHVINLNSVLIDARIVIDLRATCAAVAGGGVTSGEFRLAIVTPTGTTVFEENVSHTSTSGSGVSIMRHVDFRVVNAGNHSVQLQARRASGDGTANIANASLRTLLFET